MNRLGKRILPCLAVGIAVCVGGCAEWPTLGSGRTLPADAVFLGSNETITLIAPPAQETHTYCSNGMVLECERFGLKIRCSCPVIVDE
jgi:hypothetical protein